MDNETDLFVELWGTIVEYISENDKLGVAIHMIQTYEEHGHSDVIDELIMNKDTLDEYLSKALEDWE